MEEIGNFYTDEEKQERKDYVPKIRKDILKQLKDLKDKIKNNEELPHGEQDIDLLVGIHDRIEECLNNWYY